MPGAAPSVFVMLGGHWVAPIGPQVLPGGCLVVTGHKMNVLESLGKGVFGPLAPRGGVWGDPPPILGRTRPPGARRGVWGDPPPF